MNKVNSILVVFTVLLFGFIVLSNIHNPKASTEAFRIAWKHGNKIHIEDIPKDGRTYWIFTRYGVFYTQTTTYPGIMFTVTDLKNQLGKDDQKFVMDQLEDIQRKWR